MSISINHATKVITIPKADTTFGSTNAATGYEIRTYDEYALMRELADYLDSDVGMALPVAFSHNTQVTISGVAYARSLTFLAPYTVTFEDGAYQVRLVGGTNNNLLDVLNPNGVSVISANSAGLQTVATGSGPSASDVAAAVWSRALEGLTAEEMLRIMLAALAGKRQGLGTATEQYLAQDGTTPRITLTADSAGNGTPTLNGAP
jgi:hypothetical protein